MKSWRHRENKVGRTKVGEDFKQQRQEELRPNEDVRRTVVAYGNASICGTYKGNTPITVKLIQRAVAGKTVAITVDEFLTSRKHRSLGSGKNMAESRSGLKRYDDENYILHRTSQCHERRLSGNRVNYPPKLCPKCTVNNGNRLYWNRDVNAAANIRSILVEYIRQDFNLDFRPAQLSRGQQDQGL
ncbi:hypothetical protein INT48_005761 [Thamnidium elegans]|uniref:Uncharacterized protein n=1 Tax=Thamnidium elegans TaxID=101142 RepID=A0A8H7SVY5_9FUNG|nr:hypothetical protein INT48_005761 [Thamnidium elegans]